ncbi:MAG: hypothetical protein ABEK01_02730 [Candidatus Nanohaloarchaea archaeon]
MVEKKGIMEVLIGAAAGYLGFRAYSSATIAGSAVVMLTAIYLAYRFTDLETAWTTFSWFKDPARTLIIFGFVGFSVYAVAGGRLEQSLVTGLGTALVGSGAGIILYRFWNIGG